MAAATFAFEQHDCGLGKPAPHNIRFRSTRSLANGVFPESAQTQRPSIIKAAPLSAHGSGFTGCSCER